VEAGVREQYDIEGTIGLLQEYLNRSPDNKSARLQLSVIGVQLGRHELISSDSGSLPSPDETAPENWKAIVRVIKSGGHLWAALLFAYRVLRLYFGNVEAHRAYMAALMPTEPLPPIPTVEVVGAGTAVAFREEGLSQIEWRVIEEDFEPDVNLQEIGPGHFTALQLAGKRVGDEFILAQGSVVSTRGTVVQILSKYVYRFQDCGQNWLRRFPEHPDVQTVRVVKRGAAGGEETDFTSFFQSFDRMISHQLEVIDLYRSHPIPFHLLARQMSRPEFEQCISLAIDDSVRVRCCSGNAEERAQAILALKNASAIVLDLTSLSTLSLLDSLDDLKHFQTQFLVSEHTISEMRRAVNDYAGPGGRTGMGMEGHRYLVSELSPEAVTSQRQYFESLLEKVRSRCTVVGCPEFAAVSPGKRKFLIDSVGEHGAHSILLASAPGRVLWADDYGVAVLAMHEFGVRRVWTQVVLQERAEAGAISADTFIEATAKLLGWRYYFTSPSVPALVRAGSKADWNPDRWPLSGALEIYSDSGITARDAVALAVTFILHYANEVVLPQVRSAVTVRILEQLARRGEGLAPVGVLLRALPSAFGLNLIRASELIQVVNAWIANRQRVRRDP